MKPLPKLQHEIVWRDWKELGEATYGYLPTNRPADGFYAYARCANGDEWSLIAAVMTRVTSHSEE